MADIKATFEIHAHFGPLPNGLDVYIVKGDSIVTDIKFEKMLEGGYTNPSMSGRDGAEFLRAALNAAWELGYRPDGYLDVRESMKATNAHLQDMRAIAFASSKAEKP